jgi:hypothetical protein
MYCPYIEALVGKAASRARSAPSSAQVKIIDFGAAVDLCTGINFNPLYGMLDPRYCPPEELVMPQSERAARASRRPGPSHAGRPERRGQAHPCGDSLGRSRAVVRDTLMALPSIAAFPRAPAPALAALLSPAAWVYGRPDLFDSYTAGVLLVQVRRGPGATRGGPTWARPGRGQVARSPS